MADFYLTQNDTRPSIQATLVDAAGVAVDLTSASAVDLQMQQCIGGSASFEKAAVVVNAALGQVRYDWAAGDTASTGLYNARFEVTWSSGDVTSFPNGDPLQVSIARELLA